MFDEMHEQIKSMVLTEEEQDYLAWIKMKGVQQGADQKAKWDEYAINKAAIDRGQNMAKREMAKKMLLKNKPIEEIVEFTDLPESDVLAIKAEIEKQ